jgi:hypothetical protein
LRLWSVPPSDRLLQFKVQEFKVQGSESMRASFSRALNVGFKQHNLVES